ncbi:glycoside hydrolase family 3 N-terminal domain-containing protein [Gracilibacillus sp. YIM 98692]|uniref:glycoside hydrolase family 3 protein n=1 Tax=Gracilibacillus sp. YIM 98692 TaxID=2663532 RepID=UPI0013D539B8|nr:glycoside hydrolase family 3 N-terminal domain-containing protein [Gracilibacillus sp. YIM 98692]
MIKYKKNKNGPVLGFSMESGVTLIEQDGLYFKDLNKSGDLEPYKDWRLSAEERAKDLASKLSIEEIAGLMLYSRHQSIPAATRGPFVSTYDGKTFDESDAKAWELSDQQKEFLVKDHLRHVLVTTVETPETAAKWNNHVQALVEGIGHGIPANNSSDPRHGSDSSKEFNEGAGGHISMWPESLGLAATFSPETVQKFGEIAAKEYRALGLTTALSPQIDIATDPRWYRFNGTFGEDPHLSTDLGRAYIDGFQTSEAEKEIADGWGYDSVNAMVKHWPGGGSGEGGRDAHWGFGKYAVYPGNNFEEHMKPFTEGAFQLKGKTKEASAVMPYYTISYDQDQQNHENVGNSYNKHLIHDLLQNTYAYEGVVCTDWLITGDEPETVDLFAGKPWGVEDLTVAERHYKLLMAGVDQFGGNNEMEPVLEAYKMGVQEHGEAFMRQRMERSAVKLLKNIFRTGLFENPYLDAAESARTVGTPTYMKEGFQAQLQSIVMLKNKNDVLPLAKGLTVYIPKRYFPEQIDWFGNKVPDKTEHSINVDLVQQYFHVTDNPEEADFALVCVEGPDSGSGYSKEDRETGGSGYMPISLQYHDYTATTARKESLAGDNREVLNRSYKGNTVQTKNKSDLDLILQTKKKMKDKPVIVSMLLSNPAVVSEFENEIDGLFVQFGVQDQALLDTITGESEPSGLLPMQMPKDMETVEKQYEDMPHDMACHIDTEGNKYDFAYGLNWQGVIEDERTKRYKK